MGFLKRNWSNRTKIQILSVFTQKVKSGERRKHLVFAIMELFEFEILTEEVM